MNTKNLLIASLIGGLISILLSNVPILNFVNCLSVPAFGWDLCSLFGSTNGSPGPSRLDKAQASVPWRVSGQEYLA